MSMGHDEIFTAAIEGLAGHPATTAIGPRRSGIWEDDLAKGGRGPGICEAAMLSASRASYMGTAGVPALAGDLARTVDAIECNCINTSEAVIHQKKKIGQMLCLCDEDKSLKVFLYITVLYFCFILFDYKDCTFMSYYLI